MIRFLNLKDQITEGENDFAFYDTISNTICCFGEQQEQVFGSIEGFKYVYDGVDATASRPLSRFIDLIPDDFFKDAREQK